MADSRNPDTPSLSACEAVDLPSVGCVCAARGGELSEVESMLPCV
jgi:hypothetical protein